jgi:hypothetical protein
MELDPTNQLAVQQFFAQEKATQVYLAAVKVGVTHAESRPHQAEPMFSRYS